MNFRVGQRVVCVDASEGEHSGKVMLTLNAIYTVSKICDETRFGERGIFVAEIPYSDSRPGIKARRFRPVAERKTDISIFTKMLTRKRKVLALSSTESQKS